MGISIARRGLLNAKIAIFRVDAGPGIGMGHFMRCRSLAIEMLKHSWVVHFVGSGLPEEMLNYQGMSSMINYIPFESHRESSQDMRALLDLLRVRFSGNVDFLIIDSYRYNRDDYALLHLHGGRVPVAVINDLAEHDTPAQVVLNPNPSFSPEPYLRQKIPCILCGEKFTLIRPEILTLRNREYDPNGPFLISLGGGDVVEPLLSLLSVMPELPERQIIVSVSENCPLTELENWAGQKPGLRQLNTSAEKFPELLAGASVAITGGGGTLWEVYCLGIPNISIVWVDNQRNTSLIIKDQATSFLVDLISNINVELQSDMLENGMKKLVETLGPPGKTRVIHEKGFRAADVISREQTSLAVDNLESLEPKILRKALSRLTSGCDFPMEMIKRQRQLIDGQGARRVLEALEQQKWQEVPLFSSDYRRSYEDW